MKFLFHPSWCLEAAVCEAAVCEAAVGEAAVGEAAVGEAAAVDTPPKRKISGACEASRCVNT
ncbi:hypothetical protein EYF80_030171 [Liparis tanakae]|uniref:Secreted protein n=1 Tax=Liparis tanakae TaxID=230148 RepID=A0A4Z2H1F4_9TELE|nr:hypothetical protein EYF80_030171 [Liparis tanakae]